MEVYQNPQVSSKSKEILNYIETLNQEELCQQSIALCGAPAVGKTSILRELQRLMKENSRLAPILISPPPKYADSGQLALLSIASQIQEQFNEKLLIKNICNPEITWDDKIKDVDSFFKTQDKQIVLLIDEPEQWLVRDENFRSYNEKTKSITNYLVNNSLTTKIITGSNQNIRSLNPNRYFDCAEQSRPKDWLSDSQQWGVFSDLAEQLNYAIGDELNRLTPLHIRLLVAISSLQTPKYVASNFNDFKKSRSNTSEYLFKLLKSKRLERVIKMWHRLSFVRTIIEPEMLNRLGFKNFKDIDKAIIDKCLLYPVDSGYELHDSLKKDIKTFWPKQSPIVNQSSHKTLGAYYEAKFMKDPGASLKNPLMSAEAMYHLSTGSEISWLSKHSPFFSDQLNYLGYIVSYFKKDHTEAAKIFKRSISLNSADDYAVHYYAYNLDCLADQEKAIEGNYKKAIELNPDVIRWHTHWINYLIAKGRVSEAKVAWNEAVSTLTDGESSTSENIIRYLHLSVAKVLLDRSQYIFALDVLNSAKGPYAEEEIRELRELAHALQNQDRYGDLFPLNFMRNYLKFFPKLESIEDNYKLSDWGFGKITVLTSHLVEAHILLHQRNSSLSAPKIVNFKTTRSEFLKMLRSKQKLNKLDLNSTAIEWCCYTHIKKKKPKIHIRLVSVDQNLHDFKMYPDPDRYLKKLISKNDLPV